MLAKAAETDQQEANDEHDLPAEIARREQRLQALTDAKTKIAESAPPSAINTLNKSTLTKSPAAKPSAKRDKNRAVRDPKLRTRRAAELKPGPKPKTKST